MLLIGRECTIGESGPKSSTLGIRQGHHRLLRSPYFAQKPTILRSELIVLTVEVAAVTTLQFLGWIVIGFIGLEILSYALHRWVFHGLLWRIHRTHHGVRHGPFERNDLFSLAFSAASIVLLVRGLSDPIRSPEFGIGVGFTLYGVLYFIVHDLFTHRRYLTFRSRNFVLRFLKRAHLHHHRSQDKEGCEPFGLFLFRYREFAESGRSGVNND